MIATLPLSAPALIIDDDEVVLKLTRHYLETLGVEQIRQATDGLRALEEVRSNCSFGLIITDLSMPKIDGASLLRVIARHQIQAQVIVLSAMDAGVRRSAQLLGRRHGLNMLGTLTKPVRMDALMNLLAAQADLALPQTKFPRTRKLIAREELESALARNEFEMHLQPKVHLRTGEVTGAEALLRWPTRDKQGNTVIIAPDVIVPVFEAEGMSWALSKFAIREGISLISRLRDAGLGIRVSVNLSMPDLANRALPDFVLNTLSGARVSPSSLMLEVTETCVTEDFKTSLETASRLRIEGVGVSIDDFGTGYSCLKQLQEFPFNELKIDRTFVQSALTEVGAMAIVKSCIGIARAFNLNIVAEGIEIEREQQMASDLGCDYGQGFFWSRPQPLSAFIRWAHTHSNMVRRLAMASA